MISSTCWPWSRKYARRSQWRRRRPAAASGADVSAGAATTTERARPSSPRMSSMNSLTSRPRSPISPTTITSALGEARHHAQQHALADAGAGEQAHALAATDGEQSELMARTPTSSGVIDRHAQQRVVAGGCAAAHRPSRSSGPRPSSGRPLPSTTRPSSPGPTGRRLAWSGATPQGCAVRRSAARAPALRWEPPWPRGRGRRRLRPAS
jgi:hypothetical protein